MVGAAGERSPAALRCVKLRLLSEGAASALTDEYVYRGSEKHKNRPVGGQKGTLCPEWSHRTASGKRLGNDMARHDWLSTPAQEMLNRSEPDPEGSGKRFATERGIAFAAQDSNDGSWHGYPEPWQNVPAALKERWLAAGVVKKRDLRRYMDSPTNSIRWALESDRDG